MKTLIQYHTDKFIQSLTSAITNSFISNIDGVLYSLHFQNDFDSIVFVVSDKISAEVNNFIIEFQEQKNIVLYYTETSEDYSELFKHAKHVTKHGGPPLKQKHIELPEVIVNTSIFVDQKLEQKRDKYCIILNYVKNLPDELKCLLYPNTKIPINMFNSPYVAHTQNLGMINSELEKSNILNKYKYFVNISSEYVYEAALCGCKVVHIDCDGKITDMPVDTNKIVPIIDIIKEIL